MCTSNSQYKYSNQRIHKQLLQILRLLCLGFSCVYRLISRVLLHCYVTVGHTHCTLILLSFSSLISRVFLHCNTVTGHTPNSYKLLIWLRLCLGLGWCHLSIGWIRFQLDILKMGMQTFQLHFDIII